MTIKVPVTATEIAEFRAAIGRAMQRMLKRMFEPDEPIMLCPKCGYRAPIYLMLKPNKYPGTPRCPGCGGETDADRD